ncbi:hypothetical protein GEMRC1_012897 [Eukaryota sp. GEM-RC1]
MSPKPESTTSKFRHLVSIAPQFQTTPTVYPVEVDTESILVHPAPSISGKESDSTTRGVRPFVPKGSRQLKERESAKSESRIDQMSLKVPCTQHISTTASNLPHRGINRVRHCPRQDLYQHPYSKNNTNQRPLFRTLKVATGLLNKLSESNKDKIFDIIVEIFKKQHVCTKTLSNNDFEQFKSEFVTLLFEKAVLEPPYVNLYSRLCLTLSKQYPNLTVCLIDQCQDNFEKFFIQDSGISDEITGFLDQIRKDVFFNHMEVTEAQLDDERCYRKAQFKAKVLGNLRFVASLILHSVFPPGVASTITKQLVQNFQKPLAIEGLLTLWTKLLESAGINDYIEKVVAEHIQGFSTCKDIPASDRCLCANWMENYYKKKAHQQAVITSTHHKKSDDGFVAVAAIRRRKARHVPYTKEQVNKFVSNIDCMSVFDFLPEFYKLQLSEHEKTAFVADLLFYFTNQNRSLLRDKFQSVTEELLKDKEGLTKNQCVTGLCKFCKDGKYDEVLDDLPNAGEFLAPVLSNWIESGIVNRPQLIDCLVNIDPFNLSGLVESFVDYRRESYLDFEWLEKNEKVCSILSSY